MTAHCMHIAISLSTALYRQLINKIEMKIKQQRTQQTILRASTDCFFSFAINMRPAVQWNLFSSPVDWELWTICNAHVSKTTNDNKKRWFFLLQPLLLLCTFNFRQFFSICFFLLLIFEVIIWAGFLMSHALIACELMA